MCEPGEIYPFPLLSDRNGLHHQANNAPHQIRKFTLHSLSALPFALYFGRMNAIVSHSPKVSPPWLLPKPAPTEPTAIARQRQQSIEVPARPSKLHRIIQTAPIAQLVGWRERNTR
jgi:hypothetical protein